MPDHQQVRGFYDEAHYRYVGVSDNARLPWHMRRVVARLGPLQGKVALDIACGTGGWLHELVAWGARDSGIDISNEVVAATRTRLPDIEL